MQRGAVLYSRFEAFDVQRAEPAKPAPVTAEDAALGKKIIDQLQRGELPQMVDWFDPGLLAKIGARSLISTTLGQYTDQRLMQAASDHVDINELAQRYNYSDDGGAKPDDAIQLDMDGAFWIDYIADLGDGFEPTYAMAYLLAPEVLEVASCVGGDPPLTLKAGELLIMGGDQVYPDATPKEYQRRLVDPYEWAFTTNQPLRKIFAIPGNHDWYDGLSSFSALFCSARDRISLGKGKQIGGWRCHQHRSYFAIKLPHNWWIWGPDIQLADNLDDSQRDYFDIMSEQATAGHKIILCLAEPSWLHDNYENMHEISMLARKHGAKICAIIAGDWHHYSRYAATARPRHPGLGVQFITCGGGGAFAHATHGLKKVRTIKWAELTGESERKEGVGDSAAFSRMEKSAVHAKGPDFKEVAETISVGGRPTLPPPPTAGYRARPRPRSKAVLKNEISTSEHSCVASDNIYPSQKISRMLCLKNLALPFRNRRFAVLVGLIYLIYAWAFAASDPWQSPMTQGLAGISRSEETASKKATQAANQQALLWLDRAKDVSNDATASAAAKLAAAKLAQSAAATAVAAAEFNSAVLKRVQLYEGGNASNIVSRIEQTGAQSLIGTTLPETWSNFKGVLSSSLKAKLDPRALFAAARLNPGFFFLLLGLWAGLVYYVELGTGVLGMAGKIILGTLHFMAHITALLFVSWLASTIAAPASVFAEAVSHSAIVPQIVSTLCIFATSILAGGLLGGLIMGLYWTLTSMFLNLHTGDAFGALGIKDYKHFLRMKLEPDKVTIYPIAVDKIPGRKGWRAWTEGEIQPGYKPKIVPVAPLMPHLIEPPIIINTASVPA
jgi:Calcineurin-like phosphoesterase